MLFVILLKIKILSINKLFHIKVSLTVWKSSSNYSLLLLVIIFLFDIYPENLIKWSMNDYITTCKKYLTIKKGSELY